ncbi:50S ribosomal protein L23 [Candidatus Shapirobacteria bacterium CG09_land_8_20_14_0_10_49_15]|uniref:Large ribosomal subunit protein uL23 n=2 Tax=Candidatus Shapironibacteriota TaxID=1752721 RepID=A0A2M8L6V4_9BACT|nr:MAG: 50S ribosomal protein L23 [Candidatus Shapirobacteria bacterium CG09_land_8_20_14_0_10_49_15]PJE69963.1 MAG: 50S ribosomal protein L23 [Candidatus Shapirobacteria bacterium CG10_big_fil_rev_8_21_14_0_10_48_15]
MDLKTVIKKPIITERSTGLLEGNQYTFIVDRRATKLQIAQAVEQFLGKVKVVGVRTSTTTTRAKRVGRQRRLGSKKVVKKAIIQLAQGDKIDFLPETATPKKRKPKVKETTK